MKQKKETNDPCRIEKVKKWMKEKNIPLRMSFIIMGVLSTIWFIIRVIPKPTRATYPCMRAAAPIASGFIMYLLSITTSAYLYKKIGKALHQKRIGLAFGISFFLIVSIVFAIISNPDKTRASVIEYKKLSDFTPNNPIGEAKGTHPGRVIWVWNPDATNENMSNTNNDYWYMDKNADQELIDDMLQKGIKHLTGKADIKEAWNEVFKYFNKEHGKGEISYKEGEKFFIKLNLTKSCCNMSGTTKTKNKDQMDSTPQFVLAILKHLIDIVGVDQSDIYCGDTYRTFRDEYWDKCHTIYPGVHYVDGLGINGREQVEPSLDDELFFSDGLYSSRLPREYLAADYFINMSCLKSHDAGGITFCAKNHQGSYLGPDQSPDEQSAGLMHYSFPSSDGYEGYGKYRHLVDYMGHEKLGNNTLLFLIDGIWAGKNWRGIIEKWNMEPFNGDYPSSIFLSQDAVAIESVGFDFLLTEYEHKSEQYPYMNGVDDYLYQAADPTYWPDNITYDPEGDGTPISSLGVYEHWNNAFDKLYSRNLKQGDGIELLLITADTEDPIEYQDAANYTAYKATENPVIDGDGSDNCWQNAQWAKIQYDWFEESGNNPPPFDENDFSGRFKASWSENYLYVLVEITDDVLNDDISDPLDQYWEEDCIEIFIDEDNSGGEHRNNFNAFAYHTSPVTGDVVDIGSDGKAHLFNDHLDFVVKQEGHVYTCEYQIKIFDSSYDDSRTDNVPVVLEAEKTLGFSIAYCEDDGHGRENFIGTISGGLDSWKNADLLGNMYLSAKTSVKINNIEQEKCILPFPNPVKNTLYLNTKGEKINIHNINIFNLNGSKVIELKDYNIGSAIDVSKLKNNTYVLTIIYDTGREEHIIQKVN